VPTPPDGGAAELIASAGAGGVASWWRLDYHRHRHRNRQL